MSYLKESLVLLLAGGLTMACHAEVKLDPGVLTTGLIFEDVSLRRHGVGLYLSTSVAARGEKDVVLYYRVRWLDGSGHDVSASEAWRNVVVQKGQAIPISAATNSSAAVDYRLQWNTQD